MLLLSKNRLDSIYFKPMTDTNDEFQEDSMFRANTSVNDSNVGLNTFGTPQQFNKTNPFDDRILMPPPPPLSKSQCSNHFEKAAGFDSSPGFEENPFGFDENHLKACTEAAVGDIADSEFKSGGEFLYEFARDEQENRKIFADNDLTINVDTGKGTKNSLHSGSSSGSSGNTSSSGDWWSNTSHLNQASRLELSNVSTCQNNSISLAPAIAQESSNKKATSTNMPNSTKNNVVTVSDYFNKVSY
jgi:hypothetical protein